MKHGPYKPRQDIPDIQGKWNSPSVNAWLNDYKPTKGKYRNSKRRTIECRKAWRKDRPGKYRSWHE